MKQLMTVTGLCLTILLATSIAFAQQPGAPEPGAPPQNAPPPQQQQTPEADRTFQGELSRVDIASKQITLKGADGKEMLFVYDDETEMAGIENSPQGLSGKTGSSLKVTYRESRGLNLASKIEIVAKESQG